MDPCWTFRLSGVSCSGRGSTSPSFSTQHLTVWDHGAPCRLNSSARACRLPRHFLAIHDEYLVTGAKDDGTFANLSGMELVKARGRVTTGPGLG